jgi:prevent-host-death family protein
VEAAVETISATQFKAQCLDVLDRVNAGDVDEVVITKRGKIVARLLPPPVAAEAVASMFGAMAGTVIMGGDVDLTEPVFDGAINAAEGRLHE